MSGWTLQGRGRLPWPRIREELAGFTCAWVGRYRLVTGEPPAEPPVTTHLWGWADGRYARVRVDGDHGYLGLLHQSGDTGDPVTVVIRQTMARPTPDGFPVELLEVPGQGPVTFVRPTRDSGGG